LAALALLALAAGYWQVVAAPALRNNPNNTRAAERQSLTQPGTVYAADGKTMIMGAEHTGGTWQTTYPEPNVFCHLTGYNRATGVQGGLKDALLGEGRYANPWQALLHGRMRGCDVYLTINPEAQRVATKALRGLRGAVIALDPRDGAIRVMASSPGYDPEIIRNQEAYDVFRTDPFAPELNRALQGLYVPGSALKIMTAAMALDAGLVKPSTTFTCAGVEEVGGTRVSCPGGKPHGTVTLTQALAQSCNITFAKIGLKLGPEVFRNYVRQFHLLDQGVLPLPSKGGGMADLTGARGQALLVHTAYGQGQTMVTPLAMARLVATLANGGQVLQPYLVSEIKDPGGAVRYQGQALQLGQAVKPQVAQWLAGMMTQTVETGTAGVMAIRGVKVAAKTGTGQKNGGRPDVWLVAFAPADHPTAVIAVVIEGGISGGGTAGPIANEVLRALLGG
jgi:peptidoglycan glycosyltransferase